MAPEVRPLLDSRSEEYAGDRLLHVHDLLGRWVQLPEVLRKGGPAPYARTPSRCSPSLVRCGPLPANGPSRWQHASPPCSRRSGPRSTSAVGRAPRHPPSAAGLAGDGLRFPVIDLMASSSAGEDIATIKAERHEGHPRTGFDLVFCGNLFHSMSPDECTAVVTRCAAALASDGALAILDFLRGEGLRSSLFSVNMLVGTSAGDVYGEEDYQRWCESAGLGDFTVHEMPDSRSGS